MKEIIRKERQLLAHTEYKLFFDVSQIQNIKTQIFHKRKSERLNLDINCQNLQIIAHPGEQ